MCRVGLVFLCIFFVVSTAMAQPSPCGASVNPEPGVVNVGQDCSSGDWYVTTDYGYASGLIVASAPMKVTRKLAADGSGFGELVSLNGGKAIRFSLDNYEASSAGFTFTAPPGTNVALLPDYGSGYFSVGGNPPDVYEIVDLTDPAISHLFIVNPMEGQQLNKGEYKTVRWVSSSNFNTVYLGIGRSPSQTSWIRSPTGDYAVNIDNTGSFLWDVLKVNSACHDFYLKISGYANDGSGYLMSTSEIFNVLHDYDYGFQCPGITK